MFYAMSNSTYWYLSVYFSGIIKGGIPIFYFDKLDGTLIRGK